MILNGEKTVGNKHAILFIDDVPDILLISTIRLKKLGYSVLTAPDGDEGLKIAREKKPGLIFLDVMMPGKDGLQVCRELKADPELKKIPVILFSAVESAMITKYLEQSGADGAVAKPFDPDELISTVTKYLPGGE